MLYLPLVFWLALLIPGYAVVCRFDRRQLHGGLLGVLAVSYLASFALLSPVAILGYVLELPLAAFSSFIVLLVLAGLVEVGRLRGHRALLTLLAGAFSVELLLITVDLCLGARVGSIMGADAITHLARIRFLLDHGLSNADPFVAGDWFFPLYHTNLLHALCAACAQLTGLDHFGVWFMSFVWAKLVVAGGTWYLTWTIFRNPWPAWIATMFVVASQAPITFMVYPNKLAPYWLLTVALGFGISALVAPSRKGIAWLAAAALVLGQTHALYGGFAIVLLAPVLAGGALVAAVRRRPRTARRLALCCLATFASLPFAVATRAGRVDQGAPAAREAAPERGASDFVPVTDGWLAKHPLRGFGGGGGWRYLWLVGGALPAVLGRRRRAAGVMLAVLGVAAIILYTPPLCTAAVRVLGAKWILLRLEVVFYLAFPALGLAGIAVATLRWRPRYWMCLSASVLAFAWGVSATRHSPHDWDRYVRLASLSKSRRLGNLSRLRQLERVLEAGVPPGATVLVEPSLGMHLVAAYDCHLVAPASGSVGVPHSGRRRLEARAMLWGPERELREGLLARYDIRFLFARRLPGWAAPDAEALGSCPSGTLWRLR